jgi:hypothetical protein
MPLQSRVTPFGDIVALPGRMHARTWTELFFLDEAAAFAKRFRTLWERCHGSPAGATAARNAVGLVFDVLTPRSIVAVFAAGYRPGVREADASP